MQCFENHHKSLIWKKQDWNRFSGLRPAANQKHIQKAKLIADLLIHIPSPPVQQSSHLSNF